jgi:LmbE family N-acetylglucosaminyl deacetylase
MNMDKPAALSGPARHAFGFSLVVMCLLAGMLPALAEVPICDNESLAGYDGLLVLAPHPDDEMLGFAGLVDAYQRQGKPVRVVVATDGDAYCDACVLWKNAAIEGETCDALDLSNFETLEVDSFAEVRRGESTAAAALLGRGAPEFLGYPDTGLGAAWANRDDGRLEAPLHRSDFGACDGCGDCAGYGAGPDSGLTAKSLESSLRALIAKSAPNTLVATTHWLDGHNDHAALGEYTRLLASEVGSHRTVAYSVIHAHTPKDTAHPDCWYPQPGADECPCGDPQRALAEPRWWDDQRLARIRTDQPAQLPDDADYGEEVQLCLAPQLYSGDTPLKPAIIAAYGSQLGTLAREGDMPVALNSIMDCNGYLASFAHRSEVFVLVPTP